MFVAFALSAGSGALAQQTKAALDPYPLRPTQTSSPRATLRGFLTNMDQLIEAWRRGSQDRKSDHAWMNALMALDFSTTPDSDSWSVRNERALMLKEILDRIEVPPDNEIPGDDDVAKDRISR